MPDQKILDYRFELQGGVGYFTMHLEQTGWTVWAKVTPAEIGVLSTWLQSYNVLYDFDKGIFRAAPMRHGIAENNAGIPTLEIEKLSYPNLKNN